MTTELDEALEVLNNMKPTKKHNVSASFSNELLCCPFCGGEASTIEDFGDLINGGNRGPTVIVGCTDCGIFTRKANTRIRSDNGLYSHSDKPLLDAAKIWNLRA